MYRNNNLNTCSQDVRGGSVNAPCGIPTTTNTLNAVNTLTTATGVSSGTTTINTPCPISWEDHYTGVWGLFCDWKVQFKADFLTRPNPCNFLENRRQHIQNKLNGFIADGIHPEWQEQLTYKLAFIQYLGFNYGCYTSAPNTTPQARVSGTPPVNQRRRRRRNLTGMRNVNRNIYNR